MPYILIGIWVLAALLFAILFGSFVKAGRGKEE